MCFTQKWLADSLFRVMPRPQWHWRVKLIAVGQDGKISWRCWIWTCGLFSDNPTPTIVAIPSNAPSKLWEWLNRVFFSSTLGFHHDKRWFFHQRPWDGQHAAIHWDFWMDDPHQWRDATSGCWMIGHGQPYVHVTSSKHGWLVESGCLELARCFSSRSKLDSPWCSHGAYYYLQYVFLLSARTCFFSDHNFGESTAG